MVNVEVPDKGFAWVVAVSSFFINFILSGHYRSVGVLYVEIINYYNTSRQEATIPFSVMNAVRCLSGPFVGIVGQRYGVRSVTFSGGLIGGIGVALCFVAPDITWMAVFWGALFGLGCSLSNTLFRVSVNEHFVKYRATAAGISISGGCVGSMSLPLFIDFLMKHYGLAGTFLILAGITLHVMPLSLMLIEPLWIKDPHKYEELIERMEEEHDIVHPLKSATRLTRSMIIHKTDIAGTTGFGNNVIEQMKFMTFRKKHPWQLKKVKSVEQLSLSDTDPVVSSKDFNNALSMPNIHQSSSSEEKKFFTSRHFFSSMKTLIKKEESESSETQSDHSPSSGVMSFRESLKTLILLYKNPMYIIICISVTSYQIIYVVVLQILIDYSIDKGIQPLHAIYLLNVLSIGDLSGRLCFGWVTDRKFLSEATFIMILYVLQGVFMVLFPVSNLFYVFMMNLFIYGMATGSGMVLFPVILYKFVPHYIQSLAIGGAGFMAGFLTLVIPSMIGYFRDTVGSYDGIFFLLGGINIFAGILFFIVPLTMPLCYTERELEDLYGQENQE